MSPDTGGLTGFERQVLEKLLAGDHPVLSALRAQLAFCHVSRREFTGYGFFTNLSVDRSVDPAQVPTKRIHVADVGARIRGLVHGAGFVLFVTDGYLSVLEGFSYDEPWPSEIHDFALFYEGKRTENPAAVSFADGQPEDSH